MLEFADPALLTFAIGVASFAAGAWLGSWFPDIDLMMKSFLGHRSIVTHSFLIPALLLVAAGMTRLEWADGFVAGFSAGVALHLAFDLFPKKWTGTALITSPIFGKKGFLSHLKLSKNASVVWLFVSVFLSMSVYVIMARAPAGIVTCGATLAALSWYGVAVKKEQIAGPLLTMLALGAALWTFNPNPR